MDKRGVNATMAVAGANTVGDGNDLAVSLGFREER
jgi:hypothetical protein